MFNKHREKMNAWHKRPTFGQKDLSPKLNVSSGLRSRAPGGSPSNVLASSFLICTMRRKVKSLYRELFLRRK